MAQYNPTLADFLAALSEGNQYREQGPPPPPPPSRFPRPPHGRQGPPPPFFFPFYEDEDEDDYYPNYYRQDPYRGPFFQSPQRAEDPRAARARAQALADAISQKDSKRAAQDEEDTEQSQSIDLIDLLNQITGGQFGNLVQQDAEQETPIPTPESKIPEPKIPETKSIPESKAEPKAETKSKPAPAFAPPKPTPVLRRHSTLGTKEPVPKIEVSQRNTTNPSLPYTPQSNVYSTDDEYIAILAIPGASLKDLDIDFHPSTNEIIIKGNISDPIEGLLNEKSILKISEIRTGSIERRFKFPNLPKINDDEIKAKYVNGLLTIRIPKIKQSESKPKIRKVTIEEVPDEELIYEENAGFKV